MKAPNAIGKIERYHGLIRRPFYCIRDGLPPDVSKEIILQMVVKAVNDTARPNGLVPTLLVFGTCPRISKNSPPTPTIQQRGDAIRKAMAELRKYHAERDVRDALKMRNGPDTSPTLNHPLQSKGPRLAPKLGLDRPIHANWYRRRDMHY